MKGSAYRICFYCLQSWYKMAVAEIISPGKKMSIQWYICNEVRNLRITSSPKIHGLFHSFTDGIFNFLQWLVMTPILLVYRSVMHQPQHVQPQTKWTFYIRQFAFYSDHALMWT